MKQKITTIIIMPALLLAVAIAGCTTSPGAMPAVSTSGATQADTGLKAGLADSLNYSIEIIGGNISPVTITYSDLRSMDFIEVKNASKMKMSGMGVENTSDYIGVPMAEILAKAGMPEGNVTYTLTAVDGYSMDYTMEQLQGATLGLKQNEAPLTNVVDQNAIVLVEPGQRGPMWIMVPVKIEIKKA